MTGKTGYWFADVDTDHANEEYRWQPCIQLDGGICHSFEVWFRNRAECENYIRENISGALLEERHD